MAEISTQFHFVMATMDQIQHVQVASTIASSGIDLTCLVESNEGTVIVQRPGMGRVVVATRSATVTGTKILREQPALVWTGDDWTDFLRKFQSCSPDLQRAILDMYHPPLNSDKMVPFRSMATRLVRYGIVDDVDLIHKLIAIVHTNGHQYYGRPEVEFFEFVGLPGSQRTKLDALFIYGSKVAHSCQPTTAYTSKTQDGCLEYKVIRPMEEGDLVTFSYLEKLFVTPTHLRRKQLLQTKSFVCKCQRCTGQDYCRFLRCPRGGCKEFMTCVDSGEVSSAITWHCPECGVIDEDEADSQTKKEDGIEQELESLKTQAMFGLSRGSVSTAKALVAKASAQLSQTHYLTLRAMEHATTVSASLAAQGEQMAAMGLSSPIGTERLRLQAAESGLLYVSACECVAAGCDGRSCSVNDVEGHEPLHECTTELFHACQDLIHVPSKQWPPYAPLMVKRYIPLMRICFGESDSDVSRIEQQIASKAVAAGTTTTSGKKNRKKKRGKKK